jgi:mRNA-degrading endonuclease RelE of RelBE toxin-antitoxin system
MIQMATDPFQGNRKALQGKEWRGVFLRRIGDYRLLFNASCEQGTVTVLRILLRSGETYR